MINTELINRYLARFATGYPPARLISPATCGDGIEVYDLDTQLDYALRFTKDADHLDLLKFVPASGAATRMFQGLFAALDALDKSKPIPADARLFLDNVSVFPFADTLDAVLQREAGCTLDQALNQGKYRDILMTILDKSGLNFAETPKAFIPFHFRPDNSPETAMMAHFEEACRYVRSDGLARLHFTVAPDYIEQASEHASHCAFSFPDTVFDVSFSVQDPETDTPAVFMDNSPVLLENGLLLKRPAGHGALIHNLDCLRADIIFIKNIDNVAPCDKALAHAHFKHVLAGRLLELRDAVFEALRSLETGDDVSARLLAGSIFKDVSANTSAAALFKLLNVPIRVCGMVRNAGAPGGGPYWVRGGNGLGSLQIVESAQMDVQNPQQVAIAARATHFNPVDIVCITKDYKGRPFQLRQFIDHETGFITRKTYRGKNIKALELPGLWNGAMARWITVFVEVPSETFNPVKTVNDLLLKGHRSD